MLRTPTWYVLLIAIMVGLPFAAEAKNRRHDQPVPVETIKPRIPLGIEGFFVRPSRRTMYIMGTAISPFFGGWRLIGTGPRRRLVGSDGALVQHYPEHVQFRITVQSLEAPNLYVDRDMLDVNDDMNRFLLNLHFRLKIFHGLDATEIKPDLVEQVGMPAEVPYDERVYRLNYTLPSVPIEDRVVLEVLRPDNGGRICKFHLDF